MILFFCWYLKQIFIIEIQTDDTSYSGNQEISFWCKNWVIITLLRPLGRIRPKRIHLGIPPISPRRRRDWAGLHAADTLRHACIDFLTYLDDQGSQQSGLCPSRERSVPGRRGHMWGYQSLPAVLKTAAGVRGLTKICSICGTFTRPRSDLFSHIYCNLKIICEK